MNRAILTTKNDFVDQINEKLIQEFLGTPFDYLSRDKCLDNSQQAILEDFMNSHTPNGFPPHRLTLKENAPIMLLRNIDPPEGLCNGTRLLCKSLKHNIIDAVISSGEFAGKQLSAALFKREKMESNLVNFTELQPLMDNWTAIVQVIEKQKVQVSRNGKRYQKLVFVDSQGQTAQALIYAGDIMFFRKYFEPYRRYYVSNARIQNVLPRYSTYPNECSWTIDNSTLVQEIDEVDPPLIPNVFNFANYNSVYQHIDTTDEIDLIGIAIHVHSKAIRGGTPTRDIILKDHTSHPMVLTLWGEHESEEGQDIADMIHTQPVVAALRVRVTSYHTMHLSTKYSSSILINPPIQQATGLRNWCSQNQEEITHFIAERTYTDRLKLLPIPDDDRVITISDLTAVAEA
ncbi:replication protein A 70 kDa DNA-binding subunit B-like [Coffea arabica]|uniref:Replication protein A 70 kDa DNA-binding subunit B-like n=1 Tax=Coffea arabica TaxID=13443 RepID=A0ABM4W8X3_COFAR